jgi:non-heme chloroperoxidase
VVFVHGLWLLPSSWDRWAKLFEDNGYVAFTPGWPDDPETVEEATEHPQVFGGKSIGQVADHFETIMRGLNRQASDHRPLHWRAANPDPGRAGLAAVSVAIDPAPRGAAAPDLGPQVQLTGAAQPSQLQPGGAADLRAVPLQLRQRRQ